MKTILVLLLAILFALLVYVHRANGLAIEVLNPLMRANASPDAISGTWRAFERPIPEERKKVRTLVLGMVERAGIDPRIVDDIVYCESGWRSNATNTRNPNGSIDRGLFQMNSVHRLPPEELYDPIRSTLHAINLIQARGFSPWVCWHKVYRGTPIYRADTIP